jgi:DNA primase
VDAVAVIGRHVELKRSGRTWKGCCPFHGERTPSFHVYPEDRHFKCYGCGEYGDVFKFLQKLQGKEFPEVVRAVAAEVGVTIPERAEDSAELRAKRQERSEVLAALDAAARYFSARLWSRHGDVARTYLAERGVTEETAKRFRIGVASREWSDLVPRLTPKGVKLPALVKSGLVAERDDGNTYDRFRGRLLFPIAAQDGEVIGFGGRVMPGPGAEKLAKYINSPESPVYKKSKVLYGVDQAREAIRRTRQAVLVEGYFDVVGLHQAGVRNAVAVCGTALTPEHVDALKRLDCREIVLLFDGDAAGVAGAARAAEAILPAGVTGKVAVLPAAGGKVDPDDFARANGGAAVEALVAAAPALSEFLVDDAVRRHCGAAPARSPMETKLAVVRELRRFLVATPAGLARSVFEKAVATRLDIDVTALAAEVERPTEPARGARRGPDGPTPAVASPPASPPPQRAPFQPRRDVRPTKAAGVGEEIDALALLASFPALAPVAEEENLLGLFPDGALANLVRGLLTEAIGGSEVPARVEAAVGAAARKRVEDLLGPARPAVEQAERGFRRAVVLAKLEQLKTEAERLHAAVARHGPGYPEELRTASMVNTARQRDLRARLKSLEKGGSSG